MILNHEDTFFVTNTLFNTQFFLFSNSTAKILINKVASTKLVKKLDLASLVAKDIKTVFYLKLNGSDISC